MELSITEIRTRSMRELVAQLPFTGPVTLTANGKRVAQLVSYTEPDVHSGQSKDQCSGQLTIDDDVPEPEAIYTKDESDAELERRAAVASRWLDKMV